MTEFRAKDLTGARFQRVSLRGATFTQVRPNEARIYAVDIAPHAERDLTSLESEN